MPKVAMQTEYFLPLHHGAAVLEAVSDIAQQWPAWPTAEGFDALHEGIQVFHCEVRVIKQDWKAGSNSSGLNPFADRDSLSIHFTWGDWQHKSEICKMIQQLEHVLKPFGARPHFGKLNFFNSSDIEMAYPDGAVSQFRALCERHDPNSKFENELVRRQLREVVSHGHGDQTNVQQMYL